MHQLMHFPHPLEEHSDVVRERKHMTLPACKTKFSPGGPKRKTRLCYLQWTRFDTGCESLFQKYRLLY